MQLRFQATPINLNAQVDRNNNKLHKFKIDRTCSGACLGLILGQCLLDDTRLACIPAQACTPGSLPRSLPLLDMSTKHRLRVRFQYYVLHVVHLSYLNEMHKAIE